jgi:hypothetical protein
MLTAIVVLPTIYRRQWYFFYYIGDEVTNATSFSNCPLWGVYPTLADTGLSQSGVSLNRNVSLGQNIALYIFYVSWEATIPAMGDSSIYMQRNV